MPVDDITDPAPATASHTSTRRSCCREHHGVGIHPAVDPSHVTRIPTRSSLGRTIAVATDVQKDFAAVRITDIIAILGMDELSEDGGNVGSRQKNFGDRACSAVAEQFTGYPGRRRLRRPSPSPQRVVAGESGSVPEQAFFAGGIDLCHERPRSRT
jgi:F0F1-type ATP synthase beta subunit